MKYWKYNFKTKKAVLTIEEEEISDIDIDQLLESKLIVYNDDVNTFDWVIESLMDICKHSSIQAEQCALMIHHNGKAVVKTDSYEQLLPFKYSLCERGLSTTIE